MGWYFRQKDRHIPKLLGEREAVVSSSNWEESSKAEAEEKRESSVKWE